MAHTRNYDNNAPATAVVGSFIAQGKSKKEQVPQPRPAIVPAQVVMPPEMGEVFNAVKGAIDVQHIHGKSGAEGRSESTTPREMRWF
ncbi:hypothetical protein HAX54_008526 [Datura stramonium]|uniref:Uncharacterized protein n=1 Tax=Datura stramonium TaxID=4076 RepID=A0ABS8TG42_DATST|nr:hypothetical protein [Datura stramonium]